MPTANFRMLRERNQQMFFEGVLGNPVGFTLIRKNFNAPLDALGEEKNYIIIKQGIQGWIDPNEGALRALAEATRTVQDFLLYTMPYFDSLNNPLIIPNDLLSDSSTVNINSDGTYTSVGGPVFLVQYIKNYYDNFFEVRCKVGQVGRS